MVSEDMFMIYAYEHTDDFLKILSEKTSINLIKIGCDYYVKIKSLEDLKQLDKVIIEIEDNDAYFENDGLMIKFDEPCSPNGQAIIIWDQDEMCC